MKPSVPIEAPQSKSASKKARRLTSLGFWLRVFIYNCVASAVLLPIYKIERLERSTATLFKLFSPPCTPYQIFAKSDDLVPRLYTCQDPQSEGISKIGAIARAQEAYYANNLKFSDSIEALTNLPLETNHYQFQMWTRPKNGPFDRGVDSPKVIITARAKQPEIRSYGGIVFLDVNGRPISRICETRRPSQDFPVLEMMGDLKTIQCRDIDGNIQSNFK